IDSPATLTITGTLQRDHVVEYLSSTASTPGFCRPIELSMPAGVSVTRGGGLPTRGRSVVPFEQIAPRRWISTTSPYSMPYPNVPEATSIGLFSVRPRPRSTDMSTALLASRSAMVTVVPPPAERRGQDPADDSNKHEPLEDRRDRRGGSAGVSPGVRQDRDVDRQKRREDRNRQSAKVRNPRCEPRIPRAPDVERCQPDRHPSEEEERQGNDAMNGDLVH